MAATTADEPPKLPLLRRCCCLTAMRLVTPTIHRMYRHSGFNFPRSTCRPASRLKSIVPDRLRQLYPVPPPFPHPRRLITDTPPSEFNLGSGSNIPTGVFISKDNIPTHPDHDRAASPASLAGSLPRSLAKVKFECDRQNLMMQEASSPFGRPGGRWRRGKWA